MKRMKSRKSIKWMLTFVLCVAMFGMSAFAMNVEEDGTLGEGTAGKTTNEEVTEPAFEACLLDKEGFTLLRSGQPFYDDNTLWTNGNSISEILDELSMSEELETHPYIVITTTASGKSESEGMVTIPDELAGHSISGVAVCAWNENPPLKVDGFEANTDLYLTGNMDGDVEIVYPLNENSLSVDVVLENLTVSGKVYTDKNAEQGTNFITIFDGVKVGGLEGFKTAYLWGDMTSTGKVEFYSVNTSALTRKIFIEGYKEENIPVFNEKIDSQDNAYAFETALTDKSLYPVYEIEKEDGNYYYYVKSNESYYEVRPYNEVAVYGEISEETIVMDEALIEELNALTDSTEKYLVYDYKLYHYEDENGNGVYDYIYKNNEGLYRITSNGNVEGCEEDVKLAAQIEAAVALEFVGDLNTVAASHNHNGGRVEAPNILISYVEPLEENIHVYEYTPITYESQVVYYNSDIEYLVEMQEDYAFYTENTEGGVDIAKSEDNIIVGLDGKIYNTKTSLYTVSAVSEEYFKDHVVDVVKYKKILCPNWENVLLVMQVKPSEYYEIVYKGTSSLEDISMPPNVKGIKLEVNCRNDENSNNAGFCEIKIPNEDQTLVVVNSATGSVNENNEEIQALNVTGNGNLEIRNSKINQNIIVADTINMKIRGENSIKSLTGGKTLDLTSLWALAVEDKFDTSNTPITGEVIIAARYDAEIILGSINAMFETIGENGESNFSSYYFNIVSERKNGQNAKIRFTSNDIKFGYEGNIGICILDAAKESVFSTNSLYGEQSCFYKYDTSDNMTDYSKSYNSSENFVDYTNKEEIEVAVIDAKALPTDTKEREAFFAYFRNFYNDTEWVEEAIYKNMGAYETASKDPNNTEGMYGLTVSVDKGNEIRYAMVLETNDGPVVDTNKYIAVPKEQGSSEGGTTNPPSASQGTTTNPPASAHTHVAGEWTVAQEATGSTAGLKVQKCTGCGEVLASETIPMYTVKLNAKKAPLQVKKSTTAIKAEPMEGDKIVKWESSDKSVVTVNQKGKIKGKKVGKATITVTTQKGATATVVITVQKKAVKVTKVKADVKKLTLKVKENYTLSVTKTPITAPDKITYTSSNKKVATVNKKGKITAKKTGKTTITIKCGKKKATIKVTVEK